MLVRPSTKKQYSVYWRKFVLLCNKEQVDVLPINLYIVADFMYSLAATTQSVSSAHMARAAIKHHHTYFEPTSEDPLDNPLIRNTFRCIRLKYQKAARKSKTLSSEVVEAVIFGGGFLQPSGFEDSSLSGPPIQPDGTFL